MNDTHGELKMARTLPTAPLAALIGICSWFLFGGVGFTGVGAAQQRRPVLDVPPGDTGRRITEDGLLANYFPARQKGPALLALAGSVGGLSVPMNDFAKALQA